MNRLFDAARASLLGRQRRRPLGGYRYVRLRWRVLFAAIDAVGWSVAWLLSKIRPAGASRASARRDPRSILMVQLDHLGDAVITTALLQLIRARYPRAAIDVLASRRNSELFNACGEVDCVHVSKMNRWDCRVPGLWIATTIGWGLRLRRRRYDMAIDVRGEFPHAVILWLCGARRRLGFNSGGGGFLLTDSAAYVANRAEIESRLALARLLDIEPVGGSPAPSFEPDTESRRRVGQILANELNLADDRRPLYVWHVGAGTRAKTWPPEHWRELLGRTIVEHDARIVLVGSAQDTVAVRRITEGLPWPGVLDCTGRLTLAETAALIERADLFVGGDSGPAHLAAAVGAPTIVLFSGTNRARQWKPTGPHVRVLRHEVACSPCHRARCPWTDHPCMRRIAPEAVLAEIERAMERTARRRLAQNLDGDHCCRNNKPATLGATSGLSSIAAISAENTARIVTRRVSEGRPAMFLADASGSE